MKNIAVVEGGYSAEKIISIRSAQTVFNNLDRSKFKPTRVLIEQNEWAAYDCDGNYSIDKNDFSFVKNKEKKKFDYAFIVIHGSPGENGKLQGYFDMIGIPYNTASAAVSSLLFQKFHCNQYLSTFGIHVAEAYLIKKGNKIDNLKVLNKIGLPCFVKPTDGGSSFGVTKVKLENQLKPAIVLAFKHGTEVIIEKNIEGRELTCGVYINKGEIKTLPITEIISENEYFDYDAKYNGKSEELTPAELDEVTTQKIQSLTKKIYILLDIKGIVRMDYMLSKDNVPYLIEINSIPGMSKESIIPKMIDTEGISLKELFNEIIKNTMFVKF
jgi:D-alanine-D-alanine ligase